MRKTLMLFMLFMLFPLYAGANATNCDNWGPLEICTDNGDLQPSYLDALLLPPDYAWPVDRIDSEADLGDRIVKTRTYFFKNIHMEGFAKDCTQTCDKFVAPPKPSLYECDGWEPGLVCDLDGNLQTAFLWQQEQDGFTHSRTDEYTIDTPAGMNHRKDHIFDHIDGYFEVEPCTQNCALVDNCPPGESQGYLGICSVTDGPYLCGNWGGSSACHPETGELVQAYADKLAEKHFLHTGTSTRTKKYPDWGQVNNWIELEFTHATGGQVLLEICNQACFEIDYCPAGEVPDAIGLCTEEQHTTPDEVGGNRVLLSESGLYSSSTDAAGSAVAQAIAQGDQALEYGAVLYRDRNNRFKFAYSNVVEKSGVLFTSAVVKEIEELKAENQLVYGYVHTIPPSDTNIVPREKDISFAEFLDDGFRIRGFFVSTSTGDLIRYRSSGYVYQ